MFVSVAAHLNKCILAHILGLIWYVQGYRNILFNSALVVK
jgi:hypothetical protein